MLWSPSLPWAHGTRIAEVIPAQGADDLLALKDNQRSLAEATALWFDGPEAATLPVPETTDADHGRIERGCPRIIRTWERMTRLSGPGQGRKLPKALCV